MQSAFLKDITRSIQGSLGRFLAIMGIVALGCGFYAGLQMCGPNMRADADALYDGTNLWDLRVISTLGFGDNDVERIAKVKGVDQVMPSLTCDAMARLGNEQVAVRISSLDVDAAQDSQIDGLYAVASDRQDYLNRPRLVEGSWPQKRGECVVSADVPRADYGIGDTIELLYGATDLSKMLRTKKLTIVGTVSSSNYPYTGSFGSTTLGSGMIDQYVFVAPSSLAKDAVHTEVYLTVDGALQEQSESDQYKEVVGDTKSRIEGMAKQLSAARQADLKAEAQKTLDEKWDEYRTERKKAKKELADAKAKLDDAKKQIADGEQELADGEAEYQDGLATYQSERASGLQQLDDAQGQLDSAKEQLEERRAEFEAGRKALLAQLGADSLDAAQQALQAQSAQLETQKKTLQTQIAQLQELISAFAQRDELLPKVEMLQQQIAALEAAQGGATPGDPGLAQQDEATPGDTNPADQGGTTPSDQGGTTPADQGGSTPTDQGGSTPTDPDTPTPVDPGSDAIAQQLAVLRAQLEQLQAGLAAIDAAIAASGMTYDQAQAALTAANEGLAQIDAGQAQIATGLAGVSQLRDAQSQLESGQAQLNQGQAELDAQRQSALAQLDQARAELDSAAAQLEDARSQLADARTEYQDGLAKYRDGKKEFDEKFGDALDQLNDAQREIDEIELPDIYALDRTQSEGAATYHADAGRIDSIADVFPFIFFLVAALVSLTTMTRMVEDDRVLIGTYKALGYGTGAIAAKYLAYAGVASIVGATVGIVILSQVLPYIVMSAYSIIYTVPIHPFPLPIDPGIALASGGLGVGVTLLATWGAVVSSLREVPALLMLPRAPKAGKRIMLERITPIWRRLSFTWKVTCRNLFRYKRRFLMTVIGISGCTALLLVGFGLHDAIWDIIDRQYGPIIHYDTTIGLDDNAIELDVRHVTDYLDSTGEVGDIVRVQNENMQAGVDGYGEKIRVNVVIPRSADKMRQAVTFRNRLSGNDLAFDDDAVLVTEKLSMKYGLDVGDTIYLYDQDDVGNAVGEGHALEVTGVAENYVGNLVYVGRNAWKSVSRAKPVFSTIYASTTPDEGIRKGITDELHDIEGVSTVIFSDETINMYRKMLSVVDMIVVVLIVSAAALAYIVLYNLTNINIGERIREIASLKVLGFTRGEVYTYIFREIALLAVIGDALGMVFGIFLERFVVTTAEVDYVMFGRSIHPASFGYAFALTLVFTVLVIMSMRHKLDRVDMVESLKSVD